jgi:20S proteasome alpha/beta subunit
MVTKAFIEDTFLGDKTTNDLESDMTVCIAAICEKGNEIIFMSDRLLTSSGSLVEFEHSTSKIRQLTENCSAAYAGDTQAFTELFERARLKTDEIENVTVSDVGKCVHKAFFELRREKIEDRILRPRGFRDFEEYLERQQQLVREVVLMIEGQIDEFELGLHVLVAGVGEDGAHIYSIKDPCDFKIFDDIGYHAIGIGARHALTHLMVKGYDKDTNVSRAMLAIYEAKKIAESAPGVGPKTTIVNIMKTGPYVPSDEQIGGLNGLYKQKVKDVLEIEEKWGKKLDEIDEKVSSGKR